MNCIVVMNRYSSRIEVNVNPYPKQLSLLAASDIVRDMNVEGFCWTGNLTSKRGGASRRLDEHRNAHYPLSDERSLTGKTKGVTKICV